MRYKKFDSSQRRLSNAEYRQYLYEKYKVEFSKSDLCFKLNGKSYPNSELILKRLHKVEKTEVMLTFYVFVIFFMLVSLAIYGVNEIDLYLQSFRA